MVLKDPRSLREEVPLTLTKTVLYDAKRNEEKRLRRSLGIVRRLMVRQLQDLTIFPRARLSTDHSAPVSDVLMPACHGGAYLLQHPAPVKW